MKENSLMHIFGEGGVLAKAANVFENASEKGNWEEERGRGRKGFELKRVLLQSILLCANAAMHPHSPSFFAIILIHYSLSL